MNNKKDNVDANAAANHDVGKSNKLVMVLLIITIILLLCMGGFFGYMYFNGKKAALTTTSASTKQNVKTKPEKTMDFDEFVINLADESPTFVKIKISVAFVDKASEKELAANVPQLRHVVNNYLWSKKSSDFEGKNNLNKIVNELKNNLNLILKNGSITNVYIRDILIS